MSECGPQVTDEYHMRLALAEAQRVFDLGEVPVGAIIVRAGEVFAVGANERERSRLPTAHAEMVAIQRAAERLQDWRLEDCTLFVTLEPCPMCAGAILQARIPRVVFGATDPKAGAVVTLYQLLNDPRLNHQVAVDSGLLAAECGEILTRFFRQQRALGKK